MHGNIRLSSRVTINDYTSMERNKNVNQMVKFIKERFTERYITPMRVDPSRKNGFAIMAISCLMIEALESFYEGWPDTKDKSKLAFLYFFDRNHNFSFLRGYSKEFYTHVRCGILHQAETTGGWKIQRKGSILDEKTKTINATKFHKQVEISLSSYCKELQEAGFNDAIWIKCREKLTAIRNNCLAR